MRSFPLGGAVTLEQLDVDPHPVLARLRQHEPVSWIEALDGWLVTRHLAELRRQFAGPLAASIVTQALGLPGDEWPAVLGWYPRRALVRLSIASANRDPEVFSDPDGFDATRPNARRHRALAQGPHVRVGVHLARFEASIGVSRLIDTLPRLRLDPERPAAIRGLVFRKPPDLHVLWDT